MLSPIGYKPFSELLGTDQETLVQPGETIEFNWNAGLNGDWLMLFLPNSTVYDYVQWGTEAPASVYFETYTELETVWPGGATSYVEDLPPYTYSGTGDYGVEEWNGQQVGSALPTSPSSKPRRVIRSQTPTMSPSKSIGSVRPAQED